MVWQGRSNFWLVAESAESGMVSGWSALFLSYSAKAVHATLFWDVKAVHTTLFWDVKAVHTILFWGACAFTNSPTFKA